MTASTDPRGQMVEIAQLMFTRFLTNSAGGNVSCRVDERIYVTPRYLGSKYHWKLKEAMVLVFEGDFASGEFNCVVGDPAQVSRESKMHFACYQHFPEVNGVIHAHPMNLNVYASMGQPLTPTNQYTEKFGEMSVVPNLPAHSQDLADAVVEALTPRRETLQKNGLGLILNWHGVATVGRDLLDAYDTLERLEWSAYALLMRARA